MSWHDIHVHLLSVHTADDSTLLICTVILRKAWRDLVNAWWSCWRLHVQRNKAILTWFYARIFLTTLGWYNDDLVLSCWQFPLDSSWYSDDLVLSCWQLPRDAVIAEFCVLQTTATICSVNLVFWRQLLRYGTFASFCVCRIFPRDEFMTSVLASNSPTILDDSHQTRRGLEFRCLSMILTWHNEYFVQRLAGSLQMILQIYGCVSCWQFSRDESYFYLMRSAES